MDAGRQFAKFSWRERTKREVD